MPTNLYGPGDNFDLQTSHVLPAWIRKFHEAKRAGQASVELWGSGNVRREFALRRGSGGRAGVPDEPLRRWTRARRRKDVRQHRPGRRDIVLRDLAELVRGIVGYSGNIVWNTAMPDGTPRKLLDVGRLHALGWKAQHSLEAGIRKTYAWYQEHVASKA